MQRELVIDGNHFDSLDGFYNEVEHIFTKDLSWKTGRNFNAFNDVLRGGFGVHEYGEPICIKWLHSAKSRKDLGYPATIQYYTRLLKTCHPGNAARVQSYLDETKRHKGPTLFDSIVEIILGTNNSGHDCTLEFL